jgi:hypothetical protein
MRDLKPLSKKSFRGALLALAAVILLVIPLVSEPLCAAQICATTPSHDCERCCYHGGFHESAGMNSGTASSCMIGELPAVALMAANNSEIQHLKRKAAATNEAATDAEQFSASPSVIRLGSFAFAPPAGKLEASSAATVLRI